MNLVQHEINQLVLENSKLLAENDILKVENEKNLSSKVELEIKNQEIEHEIMLLKDQIIEIETKYKSTQVINETTLLQINRIESINKELTDKINEYIEKEYANKKEISELESKLIYSNEKITELESEINISGFKDENIRNENIRLLGKLKQYEKEILCLNEGKMKI